MDMDMGCPLDAGRQNGPDNALTYQLAPGRVYLLKLKVLPGNLVAVTRPRSLEFGAGYSGSTPSNPSQVPPIMQHSCPSSGYAILLFITNLLPGSL